MSTRLETDTMGTIAVAADRYWGAQTQRSLQNFEIGERALHAADDPRVRHPQEGRRRGQPRARPLARRPGDARSRAPRDEVIDGRLDAHFPLVVFQTGSGTQTNMNVNEVIGNRAIELAGGVLGSKVPVHPNDHVNMSQSSNDTFPTAMHIAAAASIEDALAPRSVEAARRPRRARPRRSRTSSRSAARTCRTPRPSPWARRVSGWVSQLDHGMAHVRAGAARTCYELAIGGTAVGTGLNAPPRVRASASPRSIAELTGAPFVTAPNKFEALAAHDALAFTLGCAAYARRLAHEDRQRRALAGVGPALRHRRARIPENEPGSSIMPGKVNPTQSEAMTMVVAQVLRQRRDRGVRRQPGQLRAQRVQAGDHLQRARVDAPARRRVPTASALHCAEGHRAEPRSASPSS